MKGFDQYFWQDKTSWICRLSVVLFWCSTCAHSVFLKFFQTIEGNQKMWSKCIFHFQFLEKFSFKAHWPSWNSILRQQVYKYLLNGYPHTFWRKIINNYWPQFNKLLAVRTKQKWQRFKSCYFSFVKHIFLTVWKVWNNTLLSQNIIKYKSLPLMRDDGNYE